MEKDITINIKGNQTKLNYNKKQEMKIMKELDIIKITPNDHTSSEAMETTPGPDAFRSSTTAQDY